MPLLNDAKTCYVGTQPITKIMAGAVKVWPNAGVENLQLINLTVIPPGSTIDYIHIVFESTFHAQNCAAAASEFQVRWKKTTDPDFNSWQPFNGLTEGTDLSAGAKWKYYQPAAATIDTDYQGARFEIRGNGGSTESITIDLSLPLSPAITHNLNCY